MRSKLRSGTERTQRGSIVTSQQYSDRNACSLKSCWHILASSGPGGTASTRLSVGCCSPADVPRSTPGRTQWGRCLPWALEFCHSSPFHPVQRSPRGFLAGTQRSQQKDLTRMTDPTPWNANPAQFMVHNYIQ